jgi:hypothetical protein
MMVSELLDRGEVRTRLKRGQQYELTRIEGLFGTEYPKKSTAGYECRFVFPLNVITVPLNGSRY